MSGSAAALVHERAGRVELESLGLRVSDPSVAEAAAPERAAPTGVVRRPFAVGGTRIGGVELEVALEVQGSAGLVHLRATSRADRPLRLDAAVLGLRWRERAASSLRYLRHGWQSWSLTESRPLDGAGEPAFPSGPWLRGLHHALSEVPADRRGWHESELVGVVGDPDSGATLLAGVYERGASFGLVYLERSGEDVRVEVELRAETVLAPGASLPLEIVRVALGSEPSALLEDYALDHGRRCGARVARPTVLGWCSWYYAFQHVREDDVLRNLDALAAARDEIPVEVVQLDDGYQRAVGDWRDTNEKFPRGLAPLAEQIRAAGFVPGLWTAPFCAVPESDLLASHPEWLLRGPGGGEPLLAMLHPDWARDGRVHALDAGRPEVVSHLEALFRDLVAMGFLYLKLDFLFVQALAATGFDPALGRAARLRRGLAAVREGAGDEVFLLGCGCPLGAAVGVVDGMRIGPDVAPRWHPDPGARVEGIEQTQPSARSAIRSVLARAWMHRRLWLNDPDCLMVRSVDTGLARGEREALASALAATGGLCVFSDDLPGLAAEDRALLAATWRSARAVDGSGIPGAARALDLLDGADGIPSRVVADDETGRTTGLVNAGEAEASFPAAAAAVARIGPAPCDGRVILPPHAGALLRERRPFDLAVFCDFDGTFSVQDVGATLAARYAPDRRPAQWARYERGEITPWEYNREILHGLPVSVDDLERFLRSVDLDPGARALLGWCHERGVPFRVLSDGFDWNLNRLQVIHGVRFAYSANHLRVEGGRWRIRAGHPDPDCGCGTGTCKGGILRAFRAEHPGVSLVHVGNGRVSDTCGALAADLAFAKDSLATELEARGEPFAHFRTLHHVNAALEARAGAGPARDPAIHPG